MAKKNLTPEQLRTALEYEPETGFFRWRHSGKLAGWALQPNRKSGISYWKICVNYQIYTASHLAWLYMTGAMPPAEIDHVNRNSLDDRFANLRLAESYQNNRNRGVGKNNRSGVTGVIELRPRIWRAQIWVKNKTLVLGTYSCFELAVTARKTGESFFFGEFACAHNLS